jgi:carbamate kinase
MEQGEQRRQAEMGWNGRGCRRGWRRVVVLPLLQEIVEIEAAGRSRRDYVIRMARIPVAQRRATLRARSVIDKDLVRVSCHECRGLSCSSF